MDSRERVIAAITFGTPDRIPVDIWTVPAVYARYGRVIDEIIEEHTVDIARRPWDPATDDPRTKPGVYEDEWGCVWECVRPGYVGQVIKSPLADWRALDSFKPPFDLLKEKVRKQTERHPEPGKFWIEQGGGECFHRMCHLRDMPDVLMDLMDESPQLYRLRDMMLDYCAAQTEMLSKSGIDAIRLADDFGAQRQLFMPPSVWRSFYKPFYREIINIAKSAGKFVFFHTCGYTLEIIDDLIELGVDALNSQVWCMGPQMLGERFKGKITFWGELSRQDTIPKGTPDDIRAAASIMKEHMATEKGGLIGQGQIDGLTPMENILAMLTAWNEAPSEKPAAA